MGERSGPGPWGWIDYEPEASADALESAVRDLARLVRAIPDPNARCADLDWTCGETAAHIALSFDSYTGYLRGDTLYEFDLDRIAASQVELIATVPERDPEGIAAHLESSAVALLDAIRSSDPYAEIPYHDGRTQPAGGVVGIAMGEVLLHGLDLAATIGEGWPIDDDACRHAVRGTFGILQHFVRPEVISARPCTYDIRIAGVHRACFAFVDGGLTITPEPTGPVDCHMAMRPRAWILSLYGRRSPLSQVLRGRAIAWGRQPLAAFRLRSYASDEV